MNKFLLTGLLFVVCVGHSPNIFAESAPNEMDHIKEMGGSLEM